MVLGLLVSYGASARNLCFQVKTDYPLAVDVTVLNPLNQTSVERFELVPGLHFCQPYSELKTKRLNYIVHGMGDSCIGEIKGDGNFTLVISDNGCKIFKASR